MFHHWCYDRLVLPCPDQRQFLVEPILPGRIYPTLYLTKEEYDAVKVPENSFRFVVIRDLRDTLVSLVFSVMFSHKPEDCNKPDEIIVFRDRFCRSDVEDAMVHLMRDWLKTSAEIQASWIAAGEPCINYRDLLANDVGLLVDLFKEDVPLNITKERLEEVILANRFEKITGGRKPGVEDVLSHERKGIAGDWKNYFTVRVAKEFNRLYGDLLIKSGCEANHDWAA